MRQFDNSISPEKDNTIGKTYSLSLRGTSDGYICKIGDEEPQSGGFDFKLIGVDADYQYVGMFISRKYAVKYSNVKLFVKNEDGEYVVPDFPQIGVNAGRHKVNLCVESRNEKSEYCLIDDERVVDGRWLMPYVLTITRVLKLW